MSMRSKADPVPYVLSSADAAANEIFFDMAMLMTYLLKLQCWDIIAGKQRVLDDGFRCSEPTVHNKTRLSPSQQTDEKEN